MYNLKESMLARCYIDILSLEKHSEAAQRLIKWKQPAEGVSHSCVSSLKTMWKLTISSPQIQPEILPKSVTMR